MINIDEDDRNADWIKQVPPGSALFNGKRPPKKTQTPRGPDGRWQIIASAADLKYTEDQPRDERGRFSGAGSAGEAADFTRAIPGIKNVVGAEDAPLHVQNIVNRGLDGMQKAGYGMPETISYEQRPDDPGLAAQYDRFKDTLTVNTAGSRWQGTEEEIAKNAARDGRVGRLSTGLPEHPILHELAHREHFESAPTSAGGSPYFARLDEADPGVDHVSAYAGDTPQEFVAETHAGMVSGKSYPDDVMRVYDKYRGPAVKGTYGG